jgi:transposase
MRGRTTRQITFLGVSPDELISANDPIPPEHLLKAGLLMAFYSIRSERQFCERLQYDLLFKWFLDLNVEDPAFDQSTFAKNRERLLKHDVSRKFFEAVLNLARQQHLLSNQHFTVDGTLLESWASLKSLKARGPNLGGQHKPKAGKRRPPPPGGSGSNPEVDFHGEKRSNDTYVSGTDPEARLARKGTGREAKLSYAGHLLMENRHGLAMDVLLTLGHRHCSMRDLNVTPHVAQNITKHRGSRIGARTVCHSGYAISQRLRKRVGEIFGWLKAFGGGRKLRYLGLKRNQQWAELATGAFNLVRISNLMAEAA